MVWSKIKSNNNHCNSCFKYIALYITLSIVAAFVVALCSFLAGKQSYAADSLDARSPDDIQTRVNQFYAYTKLQACHDAFANEEEHTVRPDQIEFATYGDPNAPSGMTNVGYYYRGFTNKGGPGELCSTTAIDSIANELGMDIDFLEILRKRAGRDTKRCPDEAQTDKTCWNGLSTMSVADEITKLLKQASSYSSRSMEAADWFIVYDKAFDVCTGVSGFGKYTTTTNVTGDIPENSTGDDGVWRFKGSTMENLNDDGEYDIVTVYAPVDAYEYRVLGHLDKVAHSVWYGTAPAKDNVSGGVEKNCDEIAQSIRRYFPEYIATINRYMTATGETVSADDVTTSTTADDEEDPCEAGFLGFGWLFCPGANLIDRFLNGFLNWIDSQLNWTMLAENNTVIRERWRNFLNIANIAFAIAFLVMIYSMATSTGLSNYDIKKMLPRLIVVAIAVNLSFYICAAIVDIFNIIGNGIFGIINPDGDTWSVSVGVDGFVGFGATIVAIIGVVFIFGISAIIALAIIFICLCVREIALIALVVISPIAFVCYLLPNTQKWFQRWADYFIRLLAIYPMFMAVWGAAKWVASLKGSTPASDDVMPGFVISLTCMIAPAIAIIPLFKMSGDIMSMAASRVAGSKLAARGQAAQGYMRNRGKQAYHNSMIGRGIDRRRERAKDLDKQVNEGSYAGYNPWRRARQAINRGVNKIPVIGGAKGVSSDKDLGNFLKNYTYADWKGNVQHLTDDQMLDYVQGRAVKDADGRIVLAAQNLNAEQIGSGIKALSGNALEDVSGKTTTGGAPVAATDASKRYAHLQATSYMHEMYAKHGIDIGKGNPSDAYKQLSDLATSGSYVDKSGTKHTFGSHSPVRSDAAEMKRRFDANAGSADAEKIFNEEAKSFQTKRQSSAIKTTISGFTDAAAKRESDEISQALGSAMKAREFKKNAFKSGTSTPPSP